MLKPGDIVTDIDPESTWKGIQGEVVHVQLCLWEPPEVVVRFDRELYPYHLSFDECLDGFYDVYQPHELRQDEDWEPEVYARRLFGHRFHSLEILKAPLDPSQPCMVNNCVHQQSTVAWINIWGTVLNVFVCAEHAEHYRVYSCMDSFPWRRKASA